MYIRHRALGHQWSVSNAVGVCQLAFLVVLLGDHRPTTQIGCVTFFLLFFRATFGTVQKSLSEALGAILPHFLFDFGLFLGAPGPLKNSPKCCKGHDF